MVDVIVYKPSPYGLVFIYMINPLGYALGFIIYHTKHERVYVSYIYRVSSRGREGLDLEILKLFGLCNFYKMFKLADNGRGF